MVHGQRTYQNNAGNSLLDIEALDRGADIIRGVPHTLQSVKSHRKPGLVF